MRWKLFTLVAVLALMVSTVSPVKVKAQGLVEYALILVVVGIGTDQKLELYYRPRPSSPDQIPIPTDRVFFNYNFFTNVTDPGDATCTQTVQIPVTTTPGLNTLTLETTPGDNKEFLVNGKPVALLDPSCFTNETKRVVLAVGVPPASDRGFNAEFGLQLARHFSPVGQSIVNPDGSTATSIGLELPQKFLVYEDN